ncbi:hypothetical protein MKW94_006655, partial [Papaver nudicaule]|nr:hypothetical protein [Papaver nudicaule]
CHHFLGSQLLMEIFRCFLSCILELYLGFFLYTIRNTRTMGPEFMLCLLFLLWVQRLAFLPLLLFLLPTLLP